LKGNIIDSQEENKRLNILYEEWICQLIDKYLEEFDEQLQWEFDYYIAFDSMKEEHGIKLS